MRSVRRLADGLMTYHRLAEMEKPAFYQMNGIAAVLSVLYVDISLLLVQT